MSDLQIALILLGALIIAGVVVYNWLQERKLRRQVSKDFIVPQADVLIEDFYIDTDAYVDKELAGVSGKYKSFLPEQAEKVTRTAKTSPVENTSPKNIIIEDTSTESRSLDIDANSDEDLVAERPAVVNAELHEAGLHEVKASNFKIETESFNIAEDFIIDSSSTSNLSDKNSIKPIVMQSALEELENSMQLLPDEIHPQVDLTAVLYFTKPVTIQSLSLHKAAIAEDLGVNVMFYGLDGENNWRVFDGRADALSFKQGFKQAACCIQLADRGGPVARNIINKFQYAIENMGLELNAHVEWQGSNEAIQRAIELDKFCIEVDQTISIHLAATDVPMHGTKFRGLAEANGMTLSDDGKFNFHSNSQEPPLFIAIDANNQPFTSENLRNSVLKNITFQLEIPKAMNSEQVFNQMIAIAQKMSNSLSARLVDDNQKPLGDLQIEKIRQQLRVIHATMVARGIMPGSPAAMRLFN